MRESLLRVVAALQVASRWSEQECLFLSESALALNDSTTAQR